MALKNRIVAFVAGVITTLGIGLAWGGLETGTYISDLVATNPLSSDLASTADDHLRLIKSTVKATFPNINNAITVTDEQINAVGASGVTGAANPTGTTGLAAVNGSATTFLRSDGAPALSQAISPTWSAPHIFSSTFSAGNGGAVNVSAATPLIELDESGASANNRRWWFNSSSEQLNFQAANDARNSAGIWLTVDRTGTTVDRVTFPTDGATAFVVGPVGSLSVRSYFRSATGAAMAVSNTSAVSSTVTVLGVHNENTSGDNGFMEFRTEAGTGTLRGSIDFNRAGTLTRYNTTSDIRLKKNFKPAPSARKVMDCIQVESYDWKESGFHVDHGLVAQRLEKCAPYAVSKGQVWQVDKSTLIPALIKYTQELEARVAAMERRLH